MINKNILYIKTPLSPFADLHTKRMVQRLKEEEVILCKEMLQHWTALKTQYLTLGALSSNCKHIYVCVTVYLVRSVCNILLHFHLKYSFAGVSMFGVDPHFRDYSN